jgi:signal peptidase II
MRVARLSVIVLIMLGCVGCDQVTKEIARDRLAFGAPISLLHDTVRLQLTENPGAFLSLGGSLPEGMRTLVFTLGGSLLVALAIGWTLRTRDLNRLTAVGAALACGGGLGNMVDRLGSGGRVTDFLNVGLGPLRTGIFNVADMALMLGIALVLVSLGRRERGDVRSTGS